MARGGDAANMPVCLFRQVVQKLFWREARYPPSGHVISAARNA
jgi:hypothetical protein